MNDELDFLLDQPAPPRDSFRWATVTGTSPLRIRFDGDTAPTAATPACLTPVSVGDRVWVQHHARSIIILGKTRNDIGPWIPVTGIRSSWEAYPGFPQRARRVPGGVEYDVVLRPTGSGTFSTTGNRLWDLPAQLSPPPGTDTSNAIALASSFAYDYPLLFRLTISNGIGEVINLKTFTSNSVWIRFSGKFFYDD